MRLLTFLLAALWFAAPAAAEPAIWLVDQERSRLGFTAYWQNAPVKGVFKTWRADILFDAEDLKASKVTVAVETASADTAYADRDAEIKKKDWFAVAAFPAATFVSESIRQTGDGQYAADGTLMLKGVSAPLTLPFKLHFEDDVAIMAAELAMSRLAFNIGEGQWKATNFIRDDVILEVELIAKRGR